MTFVLLLFFFSSANHRRESLSSLVKMKYYVGFKTGPLFEQEPKINKTYHSWKSEITLSYHLVGSIDLLPVYTPLLLQQCNKKKTFRSKFKENSWMKSKGFPYIHPILSLNENNNKKIWNVHTLTRSKILHKLFLTSKKLCSGWKHTV